VSSPLTDNSDSGAEPVAHDQAEDADELKGKSGTQPVRMSRRTVGLAFLAFAAILVGAFFYVLVYIITPLTQPPQLTTTLIQNVTSDIRTSQSSRLPYSVDFLVSLEYAAANIRMTGVQIAVASIGGLFLIVVGVLLFALGFLKPFSATADLQGNRLNWKDGSPGLFCALLGMALISLGVMKPTLPVKEIEFSRNEPQASPPSKTLNVRTGISPPPAEIPSDYLPSATPGHPEDERAEPETGFEP